MPALTLEEMTAASHADPIAISVLAAAKARAWCAQWGGRTDPLEMMQQIYVCRPAARTFLDEIMAMPAEDRLALARHIAGQGKLGSRS